MKCAVLATLFVFIAPILVRADEPVINEAIRKYADAVEKATEQLKTVVDADSSKKSVEALVRLDKEAGEQRELWQKNGKAEMPGGAVLRHAKVITDEFEVAWSRAVDIGKTGEVLTKLPALRKVVADRATDRKPSFVVTITGAIDAKKDETRIRAIAVSFAARHYEIKHGSLPESLNQLLAPPDGGKPFIDKEDLLDPWGLPFQYDAKGPKHNGVKPDVWSIGPDANDPNGRIGNWPATRDPKKDK